MEIGTFERVSAKKVLREMQGAAAPAARDFALAAGGYLVSEYTVRSLIPKAHPLLQGLLQGTAGMAGMAVGRLARAHWLETSAFGFGLAGAVRVIYQILSKLQGGA